MRQSTRAALDLLLDELRLLSCAGVSTMDDLVSTLTSFAFKHLRSPYSDVDEYASARMALVARFLSLRTRDRNGVAALARGEIDESITLPHWEGTHERR